MRALPAHAVSNREEEQGHGDHQQDRGEEVLAGGRGARNELLQATLASEEELPRVTPPARVHEEDQEGQRRRPPSTTVDQIIRRRGSSAAGAGKPRRERARRRSQVADHEAGPRQQARHDHLGERRRDQPARVDEVLVPEVPGGPEDEQEAGTSPRTGPAARTDRAFLAEPEARTGSSTAAAESASSIQRQSIPQIAAASATPSNPAAITATKGRIEPLTAGAGHERRSPGPVTEQGRGRGG